MSSLRFRPTEQDSTEPRCDECGQTFTPTSDEPHYCADCLELVPEADRFEDVVDYFDRMGW